jgi:hypothetical protein
MTTKETISMMLDRVEAMAADKARLADKVALLRADRELFSRWNDTNGKSPSARGVYTDGRRIPEPR